MIEIDDLEADVSEMCNLACTHCSHLSPHYTNKDNKYTLSEFTDDITILAKYLKVNVFRVLGGEPLLNRDLVEFLKVIDESKIANKISLFTNGTLLGVGDSFLAHIDELRVSIYPSKGVNPHQIISTLRLIKDKHPHIHIAANSVKYFSKMHLIEKHSDAATITKIYNDCFHAKHGKSIFKGRLYRCFTTRKKLKIFDVYKGMLKDEPDINVSTDALTITEKITTERLSAFLSNPVPLDTCKWCLGCSGKYFKHSENETINDYATLGDLDFDQGKSYISNCLYNWYTGHPDDLIGEPCFDATKLAEHGIHHDEPVVI